MSRRSTQRGATLVELAVATAIMTVISAAFFAVVERTHESEREYDVHLSARGQAERALGMIMADLRKASGSSLEGDGTYLEFKQYRELGTGDDDRPELVLSEVVIRYALAEGGRGLVRTEGEVERVVIADAVEFDPVVTNQALVALHVKVNVQSQIYGDVTAERDAKIAVLVP